jgi:MFS family permease
MQSLVIPVLPRIQQEFGTTPGAVTWVLTGNLLVASIATPILGRFGDVTGKKRALVATLAVLCLGTLLAAVARSLLTLVAARFVQGVGGGLFPLAFGIIRDEFPPDEVPGAIGMVSSTLAFGGGLGVVLAGPIVAGLNYHWLFWIPCPLIALAAVAIAWGVPESPIRAAGRVSWRGALSLSAWLVALLLALTEGPRLGWAAPEVLGLFAAAAVLFAAWLVTERRSVHPLIDVHMLIRPTVLRFNIVALLFGFVLYSSFRLVPQFLQTPTSTGYGFGASVTLSGLYLLPQTLVAFVLGLLAGQIAARIGSGRAVLLGSVLAAGSFVLLAALHVAAWQILLVTTLLGAGVGLTYAAIPNVIVDAVPREQTGVATGVNTNVRNIGGALGGQLTAGILGTGVVAGGLPTEAGFVTVFGVLAAVSAAAALVCRRY